MPKTNGMSFRTPQQPSLNPPEDKVVAQDDSCSVLQLHLLGALQGVAVHPQHRALHGRVDGDAGVQGLQDGVDGFDALTIQLDAHLKGR